MKRAGVFVLSSAWEGLPTVLIEAMAVGTPVVSTDCPSGPSEILDGGKWGRLVPVGDAEAMAKAIIDTLDSPPDTVAIRNRAEEFSVDTAVDKYLEVLGAR
jgi:glycosyltransferase involved in cell wall biosynthesis